MNKAITYGVVFCTALNRELRKSLLSKVATELQDAQLYMDNLQPRMSTCQEQMNRNMGACATCVDTACQQK